MVSDWVPRGGLKTLAIPQFSGLMFLVIDMSELDLIDRHHRMVERRIRAARFPTVKSLDTFDFLAIPSVNKQR